MSNVTKVKRIRVSKRVYKNHSKSMNFGRRVKMWGKWKSEWKQKRKIMRAKNRRIKLSSRKGVNEIWKFEVPVWEKANIIAL